MTTVEQYLSREGYKSPEDWAQDSGYTYNEDFDSWQNEEGGFIIDPYNYIELLINGGHIK